MVPEVRSRIRRSACRSFGRLCRFQQSGISGMSEVPGGILRRLGRGPSGLLQKRDPWPVDRMNHHSNFSKSLAIANPLIYDFGVDCDIVMNTGVVAGDRSREREVRCRALFVV